MSKQPLLLLIAEKPRLSVASRGFSPLCLCCTAFLHPLPLHAVITTHSRTLPSKASNHSGSSRNMEVAEVEGDHVPSVVPELPSEIIWFLILPRLPAKSLMRFKCVCKSWSSLISGNPTFLGVHRNLRCNNSRYTHLLLNVFDRDTRHDHLLSVQINQDGDGDGSTSPATHLLTLSPDYHLYDYQCTNGLFCIFYFAKPVATKTHHEHDPEDHVHIFNPSTGESIILPHTSLSKYTLQIKGHFGFSPFTNEYKLLQVQLCHDWTSNLFSLKLEILTLGSDSWRCIEVDLDQLPFNPLSSHLYGESVCLHGALHWIYQDGEDRSRIVVFDLGEERFRVITTPEDDGSDPCWTIAEVGGRLALMDDKDAMPQKLMLELWILKDYQNQVWAKETINFPSHWRESTYHHLNSLRTIHTGNSKLYISIFTTDNIAQVSHLGYVQLH
ncbi:unnamed protein product [Prunus armeniaca]|uniref:F-box domain-containing protein n=1 Tax=Prunus armeniaca TaxID=36596 RepID=A0A6J5TNU2_PRUAR|nr:unnamed protein product [Prunus armeniaca]